MLSLLDIAAILLTLCALFGWFNNKVLRLPPSIGLLAISVGSTLLLVVLDMVWPGQHLYEPMRGLLRQIDFTQVVMDGMLAFLLFAGALQVDLQRLWARRFPVLVLAFLGTTLSAAIVGFGFQGLSQLVGSPIGLVWALLFGAIISPTDPVAVLGTLTEVRVPASLEVEMQGESLLNDGIGIVLFTLVLGFARGGGSPSASLPDVLHLLFIDAGGGFLLGIVTGFLAYRLIRTIDDYPIEIMISLALVTGTYALAQLLHISGPLAMVSAGLLLGEHGPRDAMSERTQRYLFGLWSVIDEILNSVLFLLIGLEVLVLRVDGATLLLAALAPFLVLLARLVSVSAPLALFPTSHVFSARRIPVLTWGGVRGGISVALALSIPDSAEKPAVLAATYCVVVFSILVQASTLPRVARATLRFDGTDKPGAAA